MKVLSNWNWKGTAYLHHLHPVYHSSVNGSKNTHGGKLRKIIFEMTTNPSDTSNEDPHKTQYFYEINV